MQIVFLWQCLQQRHGEDEEGIADNFANGDRQEGEPGVGTREAEGYGDNAAEDGHEAEDADPCAVAFHPTLCALHLLGFHMKVLLNPFHFAKASDTVIEHRTGDVARRSCDKEVQRIEACELQGGQYGFTAEGEEAAGDE